MASGIELVPTKRLPDRFRTLFSFPFFNAMQSKCFASIYTNHLDNFILSAPTGSGKTVILELAICTFIVNRTSGEDSSGKIIYLAPTKALCSERHRDWSVKFRQVGLRCEELTGDTEQSQLRHVQAADIIITTPEKWDSMTRRWQDHKKLLHLVKLFLIDEVHILKDDRGACLEAVVSRMKAASLKVRLVALSATIPNSEDLATWLGKNHYEHHRPALREIFDERFRPVRLAKHVVGVQSNAQNEFQFEFVCDSRLPDVICKFSARKPIMIFCFTRKSTLTTAQRLAHWWKCSDVCEQQWRQPERVPTVADKQLRDCVQAGVAFHHAGLDLTDRANVEDAYLSGHISVLCCTSTLAVGVNLPCHFVIIKNTVTWSPDHGTCKEYSNLDVMQMLGRAGRPQFDHSAIAVIMTRPEKVSRYESMVQGQQVLESRLHLNLIDHLNAEICLGTIHDIDTACIWLESTFLAVRLSKNPTHYSIDGDAPGKNLKERIRQICARDVDKLTRYELARGEHSIVSTECGDAMARYYIQFDTMRLVMCLQEKAKVSEILSVIAQSAELKILRFKSGEKPMFKDINSSPMIKFPIKVHLDLPAHKVSLIIQASLSGLDLTADERYTSHKRQYSLDASVVMQHAKRLILCIIDCRIESEDAVTVRNALALARSLGAQAWDDSPHQLSQLEGVGPVSVRKLVSYDIKTLEELEHSEPHRIDMALSKNPPYGANLLQKLSGFPKLWLSLRMVGKPSKNREGRVECRVRSEIGFFNEKVPTSWKKAAVQVHFMAETSDGRLFHFARLPAKSIRPGQEIDFAVLIAEPGQVINGYVACDDIAGTSKFAILDPKIPANMFDSKPVAVVGSSTRLSADDRGAHHVKRRSWRDSADDDFGDDELDDCDLVKAAGDDKIPPEFVDIDDVLPETDGSPSKSGGALSGYGAQRKPLPHTKIALKEPQNPSKNLQLGKSSTTKTPHSDNQLWQPERLPNGKWKCSHLCKDRRSCKHECCKNGMAKPPRAPPKTKVEESAYEKSTIWKKFMEGSQELPERRHGDVDPTDDLDDSAHKRGRVGSNNGPHQDRAKKRVASSAATLSSSTAYGDDIFEDTTDLPDLNELARANRLPSHGPRDVPGPSACQLSPEKGRSLFLNNTSSPEKAPAPSKEDLLDDILDEMPLAKRRRTTSGNIATLDELEAETSGRVAHDTGFSGGHQALSRDEEDLDGAGVDTQVSPYHPQWPLSTPIDDEPMQFDDGLDDTLIASAFDASSARHTTAAAEDISSQEPVAGATSGPENINKSDQDQHQATSGHLAADEIALDYQAGTTADELKADARIRSAVASPRQAPLDEAEAARKVKEEDEAIAWVLKEFGDYVEIV